MGIEPTALAWEARVLPLYDAREARYFMRKRLWWAMARCKIRRFLFCWTIMAALTINGETRSFEVLPTVAELLDQLELTGKRLAVERNGEIVPKGRHAETRLSDGDKLEIVVAVGGG